MTETATFMRGAVAIALYAGLLFYEEKRPLRSATRPKFLRGLQNLTMGALGYGVTHVASYSALIALCTYSAVHHWGIANLAPCPAWLKLTLGFVFLDYTLYVWHRLNHEVDFLWRFHNVHHVDLDLDITTGARFHLGELALSVAVRAGEILVFGISPEAMMLYDGVSLIAVHFHHSNIDLPGRLDWWLCHVIVTPRMHGIHHSIIQRETDSNFSTVLSVWDRLHRSLRPDVAPRAVTIGVASYRDPAELTLTKSLLLPFERQRPRAR